MILAGIQKSQKVNINSQKLKISKEKNLKKRLRDRIFSLILTQLNKIHNFWAELYQKRVNVREVTINIYKKLKNRIGQ